MPDRPMAFDTSFHASSDDIPFQSLQKFAEHLAEQRSSSGSDDSGSIFISGSTVLEAAQALVLVIKGTRRSHTTEFESELIRVHGDNRLSLGSLFQHLSWIFTA